MYGYLTYTPPLVYYRDVIVACFSYILMLQARIKNKFDTTARDKFEECKVSLSRLATHADTAHRFDVGDCDRNMCQAINTCPCSLAKLDFKFQEPGDAMDLAVSCSASCSH